MSEHWVKNPENQKACIAGDLVWLKHKLLGGDRLPKSAVTRL